MAVFFCWLLGSTAGGNSLKKTKGVHLQYASQRLFELKPKPTDCKIFGTHLTGDTGSGCFCCTQTMAGFHAFSRIKRGTMNCQCFSEVDPEFSLTCLYLF